MLFFWYPCVDKKGLQPQLLQGGVVLSSGEAFTFNGPFEAAIAWVMSLLKSSLKSKDILQLSPNRSVAIPMASVRLPYMKFNSGPCLLNGEECTTVSTHFFGYLKVLVQREFFRWRSVQLFFVLCIKVFNEKIRWLWSTQRLPGQVQASTSPLLPRMNSMLVPASGKDLFSSALRLSAWRYSDPTCGGQTC